MCACVRLMVCVCTHTLSQILWKLVVCECRARKYHLNEFIKKTLDIGLVQYTYEMCFKHVWESIMLTICQGKGLCVCPTYTTKDSLILQKWMPLGTNFSEREIIGYIESGESKSIPENKFRLYCTSQNHVPFQFSMLYMVQTDFS